MKAVWLAAMTLAFGCVPGWKLDSDLNPQAVRRTEKNGELVILAQKPDDMRIVQTGNNVFSTVSFRTAGGRNGKISLVPNGEYFFISVRQSLSDQHSFWDEGRTIRDVFLIPKINGQYDLTFRKAKEEKWSIDKIIASLESVANIKELKIYCPTRIDFRKRDGSKHISQFPVRPSCESDINAYVGGLTYD